MKLLIDTQILIWFQLNHPQLKSEIVKLLTDTKNDVYVSDISLYEIAIKQTIGKLPDLQASIHDVISVALEDGFSFLPLSQEHINNYKHVPLFPDHRDPFDRIIISTAKFEKMTMVSADEKFIQYKDYLELIAG
ncbi:type II toxin-antitoxin system VapC family toxin [Pedobacter sp. MC2016-14]|uniref:type II toxin-antitoxin system VapC family toxin n=1 Tax=Pedobacter sp. MC2016-14 TaxID=2897327 RepID=UPI001E422B3C|nr:type II toxin-antitoxin system VapC family toxin [Pedobacter sp. MC2016-14]MCD0487157.1 type II toxin-antitoxin system VapC family toxin [Pedobacter sp. MC2016-14]